MSEQDRPKEPASGQPAPAKRAGVDVRAREIRTGAGLEESKYNTELIEFLQKYSVYIMLAIVLIAGGWFFYNRFQEKKSDELGAAFDALDKAVQPLRSGQDVSPEVLVAIANDHAGKASVPLLARLAAADQWLLSSSRGLLPGAEVDSATGVAKNAEDVLTSDKAAELLGKAKEQYELVRAQSTGRRPMVIFELRALFGLAAVAESAREWDVAKGHYQMVQTVAKAGQYKHVAELAEKRLADLDTLKDQSPLVPDSQIVTFKKPDPITLPQGTPGLNIPGLSTPSLSGPSALPTLSTPSLSLPTTPPASTPTEPSKPSPAPAPNPDPKPDTKP